MNKHYYPLLWGGITTLLVSAGSAEASKASIAETKLNNLAGTLSLTESERATIDDYSRNLDDTAILPLENKTDRDLLREVEQELKQVSDSDPIELPKELAQQTPSNDVLVPQPEILIRSNGTANPDILQPRGPAIPTLPRAIAPPVGDMAISNINAAAEEIDLGSSAIIPRLVLRQAPAREVLGVLARYAGLNVVFLDGSVNSDVGNDIGAPGGPPISLDLENEPVQDVFNSVLMVSGLKANRRGRTIFVGDVLPQSARNLISRTIRLNQVKSFNAATFLATQGAEYQRLVTRTEDIVDPLTQRVIGRREIPAQLEPIIVERVEGSSAPLMLTGMMVSADDRLNAVTLIGEPQLVQVATSMLTQMDARRRQVVVNVKVIDVDLNNVQDYNSSFSFGFKNGFFAQDDGTAILNFGEVNPPTQRQVTTGGFARPIVPILDTIVADDAEAAINPFVDVQLRAPFGNISRFPQGPFDFLPSSFPLPEGLSIVPYARPSFGTFNNPFQPGLSDVTLNPTTGQVELEYEPPTLYQFPSKFLTTIEATIESGSAKILTDPSVIVQEGQQATVKLTEKFIESVNTSVDPLSGVRTTTPVLADAGLTLTVSLDKVDDNGFISLSVSPTVASPARVEEFTSDIGVTNELTLLNRRELTSGLIRMRDGQTLILSGIINETDRTITSKVPVLGDIPLLGALFRSSSNTSDRNEVIIIMTLKLLDDTPNSPYGFQYNPGPEAADVLQRQGFPIQPLP